MVSNGRPTGNAAADAHCQHVGDSCRNHDQDRSACSRGQQPSSSATCSSAPGSNQPWRRAAADSPAAEKASSCSGRDDSGTEDMDEDDGCMSDADSGDSDLTARITGLEVRLARRSAEVEMLKAAVAAVQAEARTPPPPATPQPPQPRETTAPGPLPRFPSADAAGQFVVSLDGRVVLSCGPYAGKPLSQVAQQDREYLRKYLWAPPPPQLPSSQSQLLAALALRNCLPVRCR